MPGYPGGVRTINKPFAYRAAYENNNVIFEGWSEPGTAETTAAWEIVKHFYTDNNLTKSTWADKSGAFNFRWDLRDSYTYL